MLLTAESLAQRQETLALPGGIVCVPSATDFELQAHVRNPVKVFTQPLANIRFRVDPRGLVRETIDALCLMRLAGIRQLQFLTFMNGRINRRPLPPPHLFSHTRFEHSLCCAAHMGLITHRVGMEDSLAKNAVLTALVHDAATTACGDAMKNIQPDQEELFSEDFHVGLVFKRHREAWRGLVRRRGLPFSTEREITDGVQGRGLVGALMEVADTSSYLALDLKQLEHELSRRLGHAWLKECPPAYAEIFALANRGACRLWETVSVENDVAVIDDTNRLEDFLRLRALLWKHLYNDFDAKFIEALMTEVIFPDLFDQGLLNRELVFDWDDLPVLNLADRLIGVRDGHADLRMFGEPPERFSFANWTDALEEEERCAKEGLTLIRDFRELKVSSKADRYCVRASEGVRTFEKACTEHAAAVKEILDYGKRPIQLYFVPRAKLTNGLKRAWRKARHRWERRATR